MLRNSAGVDLVIVLVVAERNGGTSRLSHFCRLRVFHPHHSHHLYRLSTPHDHLPPRQLRHLPAHPGPIPNLKKFTLREIKSEPITAKEIDELKKLAGSYEALFSRVAMKYRSMGLNEMNLTEKDYRKYILEEYTFLKRPTIVIGDQVFIGSAPKTVKAMLEAAGK